MRNNKLAFGIILLILSSLSYSCVHNADDNKGHKEQPQIPIAEQPESTGGEEQTGNSSINIPDYKAGDTALEKIVIGNIECDKTEEVYVTGPYGATIQETALPFNSGFNGNCIFSENRNVKLSPFIMGKYEVTIELYETVMDGNDKGLTSHPWTSITNVNNETQKFRPVTSITWYDAVYFCNELTKKTLGESEQVYTITNMDIREDIYGKYIFSASVAIDISKKGYRLPTEAEWELSARGGSQNKEAWIYNFSGCGNADGILEIPASPANYDHVAWFPSNSGTDKHEVGKKKSNSLGIYDMSGNVSEYCNDFYRYGSITDNDTSYMRDNYVYNPMGIASSGQRVIRGGSWYQAEYTLGRGGWNPDSRNNYVGFRIVRSETEYQSNTENSQLNYDEFIPNYNCKVGKTVKNKIQINNIAYDKTEEIYATGPYGATIKCSLPDYIPESNTLRKSVFIDGRNVHLSPYIIGKYEVTQELYNAVMTGQTVNVRGSNYTLNATPFSCTETGDYPLANNENQQYRPADNISWFDAIYFCNILSEKTGLRKAYNITINAITSYGSICEAEVSVIPNSNGYRLPSEAEWEFAARGSYTQKEEWNYAYSGTHINDVNDFNNSRNSVIDSIGWYYYNLLTGVTAQEGYPSRGDPGYGTHEVGKKNCNSLGIYDMTGNALEWCFDIYDTNVRVNDNNYLHGDLVINPLGAASGPRRVLRGGSCADTAEGCYVLARKEEKPDSNVFYFGIRLVRSVQ